LATKVVVSAQVGVFRKILAPEPRTRLKQAIAALSGGKGDIKPLTDALAGFYRLRVGDHRVIFRYHKGQIQCLYAAPRFTVYEYLSAHIREVLGE
jgi:mRNA interferase RelE/StbE